MVAAVVQLATIVDVRPAHPEDRWSQRHGQRTGTTESSMANPVGESGRTIYGPRSWKNRRGALAGNVVRKTPPVPATAFVTGVQRIGGARLVALIGT